ncbi:glucose-6-phosphate isomerase [Candidatus Falkowbacteria bacterium]|nr:glucose-6-phosphate isomerase [Candidatus Falkowbacteria bacterium]
MEKIIKYDCQFMSAEKVGSFGFKKQELAKLGKKLATINKKIEKLKNNPDLSFRKLPYDNLLVNLLGKLNVILKKNFKNLVIVGIGASDLGARAIIRTLAGRYNNQLKTKGLNIYFAGNTTDPRVLDDLLKILDLKKTAFFIVSRSGSTIEPMVSFLYFRKKVIGAVGQKKAQKHFIISTLPNKNPLSDIAQKEGYLNLAHYPGGGRYSVLSANGLLSAMACGFDIKKLLAGARVIDKISKSNNLKVNSPFIFAALQYLAYKKRKQNISVLMPYNYYLNEFAFWFRQLWAESLGKERLGITPIAALGPTDQHSQLQLYIEGPHDKIITFIIAEKYKHDLSVPKTNNKEMAYLGGHSFNQILKIEHKATSVSLMKSQRPNGTIYLPELNEYYLGQLFFFFEMAAVYLGELLGINVFNQPGVEHSKKYMYGLLGRKGFEKEAREIKKFL